MSLGIFMDIIFPAALWPHRGPGVESIQLLTETYHLHVPTVLKSGRDSLLEPSRPVRGLPLPLNYVNETVSFRNLSLYMISSFMGYIEF
jgi:hypothetical protein